MTLKIFSSNLSKEKDKKASNYRVQSYIRIRISQNK